MERRALIQWLVATGGVAAFGRLSADDLAELGPAVHRQAQGASQSYRVLDATVAQTVTAAAERIIPDGDTPGATKAGVTAFVDSMLDGWYSPDERNRFLAGLKELDTRSVSQHGRAFVGVGEAEQVALLETLDGEVITMRRSRGAAANDHWFAMLKFLTVWGYCTSESAMRETLQSWPPPMRYDGAAPVR